MSIYSSDTTPFPHSIDAWSQLAVNCSWRDQNSLQSNGNAM